MPRHHHHHGHAHQQPRHTTTTCCRPTPRGAIAMTSPSPSPTAVTMLPPASTWSETAVRQLRARDAREREPFAELVADYDALLRRYRRAADERDDAQQQLRAKREVAADLQQRLTALEESNRQVVNADQAARIAELEGRLLEAQAEVTAQLRERTARAEALAAAQQQQQQAEARAAAALADAAELRASLREATAALEGERERAQLLSDELQALEVESRADQDRLRQLAEENVELGRRLVELKSREAEWMNTRLEAEQSEMRERARSRTLSAAAADVDADVAAAGVDGGASDGDLGLGVVTVPRGVRREFEGHTGDVNGLALTEGGQVLATASSDKTVRLWDTRAGVVTSTLSGFNQQVMDVDIAANNTLVVAGGCDNSCRLWNIVTSRNLHTMTGHIGKVMSVQFSGDSQRVISGSYDRTLKLWDLRRGYCVKTLMCMSKCNAVAFYSDAMQAVAGHVDGHIRSFDLRSGDQTLDVAGISKMPVSDVRLAPDGLSILTNSRDNALKLIDVRTSEVVTTLTAPGYRCGANWSSAAFSPDGRFVAAGGSHGALFVWDRHSGALEATVENSGGGTCITGVVWSPTGKSVYTSGMKRKCLVWE